LFGGAKLRKVLFCSIIIELKKLKKARMSQNGTMREEKE
jgi:hypothetical protein